MTWLAQVGHVLAKDLRHAWLPLAVYTGLVALATAHVVSASATIPMLGSLPIFVVAAGLLAVAVAVQADSPTRSDAFWIAHPLSPTAVAGAKVAFAVIVLGIGLVGQAISVRAFDVRGLEAASLAAGAVPVYGGWLLGAILVAALVRDFKGFVLALISIPVALLVSSFAAAGVVMDGAAPDTRDAWSIPTHLLQLASVAAVLALLAWVYRMRDARLRTRLLGFVVAIAIIVPLGATPAASFHDAPLSTERDLISLELQNRPGSAVTVQMPALELRLRVRAPDVPSDRSLMIVRPIVTIALRDGSTLRLRPSGGAVSLDRTTPSVPQLPGIRWLNEAATTERIGSVQLELSPTERRALAAGIDRIALDGRVVVFGVEPLATLPLEAGATIAARGHRVRIEQWSYEFDEATLHVSETVIGRTARDRNMASMDRSPGAHTALVNATRGEAVSLTNRGMSGGMSGLVLPGTPVQTESRQYAWRSAENVSGRTGQRAAPAVDAAWMREARLLVTTQVVRGTYPVRAELVVR